MIKYRLHCLLAAVMSVGCVFAETNCWQGASGGSWGDDANWSLGHVPTDAETVDFTNKTAITVQVTSDFTCYQWLVNTSDQKATITLAGGGSITANSKNDHYSKKPIVLDNVSLALNGTRDSLLCERHPEERRQTHCGQPVDVPLGEPVHV